MVVFAQSTIDYRARARTEPEARSQSVSLVDREGIEND